MKNVEKSKDITFIDNESCNLYINDLAASNQLLRDSWIVKVATIARYERKKEQTRGIL